MFVIFAFLTPWSGFGCAGSGQSLPPITGAAAGTSLEWDDLDAAVSFVTKRNELALVEAQTLQIKDDAGAERAIRRYLLVDAHDRPIEIRFTTDPGALAGLEGAAAARSGAVVVRVGRFGDDQRERALVSALVERLNALEAVD